MIAINGGPAGTREELFTCLSRDGLSSVVLGWIDLGSGRRRRARAGDARSRSLSLRSVGSLATPTALSAGPCSRTHLARPTGSCSRRHLARTTGRALVGISHGLWVLPNCHENATSTLRARYEHATKTLRVQPRSVGQTRSVFVALFGLVSVQFS